MDPWLAVVLESVVLKGLIGSSATRRSIAAPSTCRPVGEQGR
jgi:hypothetical protein